MKKQYLSHNIYVEKEEELVITERSEFIKVDKISISFEYKKLIEKFFNIKGLDDINKPYYYLSIDIIFKFIKNKDDLLKFNSIEILVTGNEIEIELKDNKNFKEYNITEKFSNYVKQNYIKTVKNISEISSKGIMYKINEKDQEKIKKGIKYIDKIFENENIITIIKKYNVRFIEPIKVEQALKIYEGGEILRQLEELKQEMENNKNNENELKNPIKRNKI